MIFASTVEVALAAAAASQVGWPVQVPWVDLNPALLVLPVFLACPVLLHPVFSIATLLR